MAYSSHSLSEYLMSELISLELRYIFLFLRMLCYELIFIAPPRQIHLLKPKLP